MKNEFQFHNDLSRNSCGHYLNLYKIFFSKVFIIFWMAAFAFITSSFKYETTESSVNKANFVKKPVPFKGNISVTLGESSTAGAGVGSHIGKFEYASVDDFSDFPNVSGTATLTAANGDQIFTTFSGTLTSLGGTVVDVVFENTITGGTGRFEGATGSFTNTGIANTATFSANTTFTGVISY